MSKLRKAVIAATLIAVPFVSPVLAAAPAGAELSTPEVDTSGLVNETDGIYRDCRDFGGGRISCAILAIRYWRVG